MIVDYTHYLFVKSLFRIVLTNLEGFPLSIGADLNFLNMKWQFVSFHLLISYNRRFSEIRLLCLKGVLNTLAHQKTFCD